MCVLFSHKNDENFVVLLREWGFAPDPIYKAHIASKFQTSSLERIWTLEAILAPVKGVALLRRMAKSGGKVRRRGKEIIYHPQLTLCHNVYMCTLWALFFRNKTNLSRVLSAT